MRLSRGLLCFWTWNLILPGSNLGCHGWPFLAAGLSVFWCVLMCFDAFWCLLKPFDAFRCLLILVDACWYRLMPFDAFWCLLMSFDAFWCHLITYDAFWYLLEPCDVFWGCLGPSVCPSIHRLRFLHTCPRYKVVYDLSWTKQRE